MHIEHSSHKIYYGDRASPHDMPATSERPSPYHNPVIENGEHVGWELDLPAAKEAKITELREACQNDIFSGFDSDALGGVVHHYPAKQDNEHFDQTNLISQYTHAKSHPGETYYIMCADPNGVWARRAHTADQTIIVGDIGINRVADARHRLLGTDTVDGLIDDVNNATTETELDAIVW
ncbi:MAG: hypothetical protein SV201_05695 [Pseudomonadota bacterium]|nr:hypothetical protein [Pseudomonadota bacterium]